MANNASYVDKETGLVKMGSYYRGFGAPLFGMPVLDYNGTIGPYEAYPDNIKELYSG